MENRIDGFYKKEFIGYYISTLVFIGLVFIPFWKNLPLNNSNTAWANHNYGLNMLRTMDYESILITEGGDNQVFSLAYHLMVENRRPDIEMHDRKGNLFVNIYGDMSKMTREILDKRMDEAEGELIRSGKPFYFTWKRPGLETLTDNNGYPYYVYPKGILFLVRDKRYQLLDIVSLLGKVRYKDLPRYIRFSNDQVKNRQLTNKFLEFFMKRGDIIVENTKENTIVRLKDNSILTLPEQMNYDTSIYYWDIKLWDKYRFQWDEKQAMTWDYLTREIIANYYFQQGDLNSRLANKKQFQSRNFALLHQDDRSQSSIQYNQQQLLMQAEQFQKKAMEKYHHAAKIGFDMTAIHFNLGILHERQANNLLNNGRRRGDGTIELPQPIMDKVIENYNEALKFYKHAKDTEPNLIRVYLSIGAIFERMGDIDPKNEVAYYNKAKKYYQNAFNRFKEREKLRRQPEDGKVKAYEMIKRIEGKIMVPRDKLMSQLKIYEQDPKSLNNILTLAKMYQVRMELQQAIFLYNAVLKQQPENIEILLAIADCYRMSHKDKPAIEYLLKARNLLPERIEINYHIGFLYFNLKDFINSEKYLKEFIELSMGRPDLKNYIEDANRRLTFINQLRARSRNINR